MIIGCHAIIYSKNPERDRVFIKDVLKFPYVDVGNGWLIFVLPPSEVAVHPSERNNVQELYLLCDDIKETIAKLKKLKVKCTSIRKQSWGLLTDLKLPGGGLLKMYQPFHDRPRSTRIKKSMKMPSNGDPRSLRSIPIKVKH